MTDIMQLTETHLAKITTTAVDNDTGRVGLVGTDPSGNPVMVSVPFELVEVAASELKRAASAVLQARAFIGAPVTMERQVAIKQPTTFQVGEQEGKVLIAFDLGMPSQEVSALPAKGAKVMGSQIAAMADKLNGAGARKSRLILPH